MTWWWTSGGGSAFSIQGGVATYALLPDATTYDGQLWFVKGPRIFAINPRGIYYATGGVWEASTIKVKWSEDAGSVVNWTDWALWISMAEDIGVGDRIVYSDIEYKNTTGSQTTTPPNLDTTNWKVAGVMTENTEEYLYLKGDESTNDSIRLAINPDTGDAGPQRRIDGLWQADSWESGADTVWIGIRVGMTACGHHVMTEDSDGHFHYHGHSKYDGQLSTSNAKIIDAYSYTERLVLQPDYSNEWTGTSWSSGSTGYVHNVSRKTYFKIGTTAPTAPVRFQMWEGTDDTGPKLFDRYYPASQFPASTEASIVTNGYLEQLAGVDTYSRISSTSTFSLLTNAAETSIWIAADVSFVREDDLMQTTEWISGETFTEDQWSVQNKKIYVCNTTGVQTGTFASNIALWDLLSHEGNDFWEVSGTTLQNKSGVDSFIFNNGTTDVIDINGNTFIRSSLGNSTLSLYSDGGSAIQDATRARLNIHNSVTQLFSQTGASQLSLNGSLAEFLGTIFRFNDGTSNRIEFTGSTSYLRSPDGAKYFQLDDTTTGLIRNGRFAFRSVSDSTWLRDVGTNARITLEGGMTFTRDGSIDLIKADATDTRLVSPDENNNVIVSNAGVSITEGSYIWAFTDGKLTAPSKLAIGDNVNTEGEIGTISIGHRIGENIVSNGGNNVYIGSEIVKDIDGATSNVVIGKYAGEHLTTGDDNVLLGSAAGISVGTGEQNAYIGRLAGGNSANASGGVRLGYAAGQNETNDNRLYIANSNTTTPLIYGEFDTGYLKINGFIGQDAYGDETGLVLHFPFSEYGSAQHQYDYGSGWLTEVIASTPEVSGSNGMFGSGALLASGEGWSYEVYYEYPEGADVRTVEFWCKPSAVTASTRFTAFSIGTNANDELFAVGMYGDQAQLAFYGNDNNSGTTDFVVGEWALVQATYDGTTAKMYVNNELKVSTVVTLDTGANIVVIGGFGAAGTDNFQGNIAQLKMYERVLSENEMKTPYLRHGGRAVTKLEGSTFRVFRKGIVVNDGTFDRLVVNENNTLIMDSSGYAKLSLQGGSLAMRDDADELRFLMQTNTTKMYSPDNNYTISTDDTGGRYNDNEIATISSIETEVYSLSDLPAAVAGVITLTAGTYIFKASVSFGTDRIELTAGAAVSFRTDDPFNHTITYTGTGTFITGLGQNIFRIVTWGGLVTLLTGVNSTYLSLQGSFGAEYGAVIFTDAGGGNLGTITGQFISEVSSDRSFAYKFSFINWKTGFNISESNRVEMDKVRSTSSASATGSLISMSGKVDFAVFENMNVTLNSASASVFNVDPAVWLEGSVIIEKCTQVGDTGTYFKTGTTGTFTVVADATIGATAVTSVTNPSGTIARFNYTGSTVYQYQVVVLSTFSNYTNGTYIINNVGSGYFEIDEISYNGADTGSFLSNSVTLTDTGTSLSDGETILIDTDESADYDGGSYVYNKQTNTVQVNIPEGKTWQATETGAWDTASLNEDSKFIEGKSNGHEENSHNSLFAYVNTNATTTTFSLANTWYPVELGTVVSGLSTSRFKYIGDNTFKITTLSPLMGAFEANLTAVKTGSDKEYDFRITVTSGTGSFDAVIKEHTISTGVSSFPVKASGFLKPGDEFQIEARVASTSQSEMTISGFNGEFK